MVAATTREDRCSVVSEGLVVKVVLSMAGPHTLEVGNVVSHLLNPLDLLRQVVGLNEVSHLYGEERGEKDLNTEHEATRPCLVT